MAVQQRGYKDKNLADQVQYVNNDGTADVQGILPILNGVVLLGRQLSSGAFPVTASKDDTGLTINITPADPTDSTNTDIANWLLATIVNGSNSPIAGSDLTIRDTNAHDLFFLTRHATSFGFGIQADSTFLNQDVVVTIYAASAVATTVSQSGGTILTQFTISAGSNNFVLRITTGSASSAPGAVAGASPAVQNGIYSIGNPVSEFIQVRFQCASAPSAGQFKRHQVTRKRA